MGPAGREAIIDHVMGGGSYLGSCAGAFLLADYSRTTLGVLPMRMTSTGTGTTTVSFAHLEDGHPIKTFLYEHGITDYIVSGIPQYGGPRLTPANRHPEGTEFLGEIVSTTSRLRNMVGTYYAAAYQPTADSGIVIGATGHFEYGRRYEHTILSAAFLNYARLRSQVEIEPSESADLDTIRAKIVDVAFAELGKQSATVGNTAANWPWKMQWSLVGSNPPWCSEFVSWSYAAAGIPFIGGSHGGWMLDNWSRVIRHFSNAGQYVKKGSDRWSEIAPKPGDYVHMKGHSAMVLSVDGDRLTTIEGNVRNRVVSREVPNWRSSSILGIGLLET
jgi:hypothetical protein